jgi:GNAT superfamily N-acetyltransferase
LQYLVEWIKSWVWETPPDPLVETILFFDEETGALAGYVTWRMWRENIRGRKEWMGQIHLMAVARAYLGKGVSTVMFATAEQAAIEHPKGTADMPFRIDVDNENTHAREIYERWGFERWRCKEKHRRVYRQMWRPPVEPEADGGDRT